MVVSLFLMNLNCCAGVAFSNSFVIWTLGFKNNSLLDLRRENVGFEKTVQGKQLSTLELSIL